MTDDLSEFFEFGKELIKKNLSASNLDLFLENSGLKHVSILNDIIRSNRWNNTTKTFEIDPKQKGKFKIVGAGDRVISCCDDSANSSFVHPRLSQNDEKDSN